MSQNLLSAAVVIGALRVKKNQENYVPYSNWPKHVYPNQLTKPLWTILFDFDSLRPINNLSVKQGRIFLGWTRTKLG